MTMPMTWTPTLPDGDTPIYERLTAALADDEQYELFRWWVESDYFRQRQLAALKRDMAVGVEDLYNDATKHLPTPT